MMTTTHPKAKVYIFFITVLMILLTFTACTSSQAEPTPVPKPTIPPSATDSIVLGDVSNDPTEKIESFQPLADYLAANLHEHDIGIGEVKIAPNLETMSEWLESGEVDIYFDSVYPVIVMSETSEASPILRRWKEGVAEYASVIFVHADSDINSVENLQAHTIGFEAIDSSSGYFMPLAFLLDSELTLAEKTSISAFVNPNEVGYFFTGDDENTVLAVLNGNLDAGAMINTDFEEMPEETKSQLRVIAETNSMPRQFVVIQPNINPDLRSDINALLLNIDKTEEGSEVLLHFEETAKFDSIPDSAHLLMGKMRALYLEFQEE